MVVIRRFYKGLVGLGMILQPFLLLAIRLFWGISFFRAGWGKLQNVEPVIEFFANLGIPLPTFNAYFVGVVESIGGLCLLFGFASRLVAIPLAIVMVVALITAHMGATSEAYFSLLNVHVNLDDFMTKFEAFTDESPFPYLLATLIILCFGPGAFSIDFIIKKTLLKSRE